MYFQRYSAGEDAVLQHDDGDKSSSARSSATAYAIAGSAATVDLLDRIKELGFRYATLVGSELRR